MALYTEISVAVQTECWLWLTFPKKHKLGRQQIGRVIDKKPTIFGRVCAQHGRKKLYFIFYFFVDWKALNTPQRKHLINNLQHKQVAKTTKIIAFLFLYKFGINIKHISLYLYYKVEYEGPKRKNIWGVPKSLQLQPLSKILALPDNFLLLLLIACTIAM